MKNLFSLLLIALSIFLINCSKDDSGPVADIDELDPALLAPLIGDWTATSVSTSGCTNSSDNGTNTCGDFTFCLFVQISDEGLYGFSDNTDPDLSETTFGVLKTLTSTSFLLCEPGLFGEEEVCSNTVTYSFTNSTTLSVRFTDDDEPGCTFSATFTKDS
ncbi:hypothetical protein [Ekhidna sp. To15]|uniref:hypothetical protein n=1 Tax=Ekhidna sp. To15 TaxID=3395267 RepID=UPI003F51ECDA